MLGLLGNRLFGVLGSFGQFRALGKLIAVFFSGKVGMNGMYDLKCSKFPVYSRPPGK